MAEGKIKLQTFSYLCNQVLSGHAVNAIFCVARKLSTSEKAADLRV